MLGARALGRVSAAGWPILIAVVLLAGCAGAKLPPFANDNPAPISPADGGSALKLARATRQAGDLTSAIQLYRSLATANWMTPEVVVEFGDVLLQAGFPDDAIDTYSQVGAKSSAYISALLGQTRAYLSLDEPAKALEYANQAQTLGPQDARVLVDRGVALDTLGQHAEAQECYRAVLRVTPRHVSARNNLALSLALTAHYDEAIALITPLVRSSAATPQVRENMAVIYALMGDADRATTLSRVDLDEGTTRANLTFLATVRGTTP